jgi:sialate O-acetylesterase
MVGAMKWSWCVVLVLASSAWAGELWLPGLFADGMVIQADRPVAVWGKADPSASVRITLGDKSLTATADASGRWQAALPAVAPGGPHQLTIASGDQTVTLNDVMAGQVWLCSGQSNMAMTLAATLNGKEEAGASEDPLLRVVTVARTPATQPKAEVNMARQRGSESTSPWLKAGPQTSGNFSGAAYYFAKSIRRTTGQPVGLIVAAYGGSMVRAWTDAKTLEQPALEPVRQVWDQHLQELPRLTAEYQEKLKEWEVAAQQAKDEGKKPPRKPGSPIKPGDYNSPSALYNGMLHPLIPYTVRGVLWYQGESDANRADLYRVHFPIFIESIRRHWGDAQLPFYFVQLAGYGPVDKPGFSALRDAQRLALSLPHTGMAVAIDVGDAGDIHPKNKQAVGERLARWALAGQYGQKVEVSGPLPLQAQRQGQRVVVRFDHAAGLATTDGAAPACFELVDASGRAVPATAAIEGATVVLSWTGEQPPVTVRYGWAGTPAVNLCNGEKLPASPFELAVQ